MPTNSISHWPPDDRPREKLLQKGEKTLSNSELLAILLRTGTKGHSAIDLSRQILDHFGTFRAMAHTDTSQWARKILHRDRPAIQGRRDQRRPSPDQKRQRRGRLAYTPHA